jgi:hypothetical protein
MVSDPNVDMLLIETYIAGGAWLDAWLDESLNKVGGALRQSSGTRSSSRSAPVSCPQISRRSGRIAYSTACVWWKPKQGLMLFRLSRMPWAWLLRLLRTSSRHPNPPAS